MFQPIRSALLIKKPLPQEVTYEVSQEIHHEPDQAALADHEAISEVTSTVRIAAAQRRLNADQAVRKNDEEGAF